jgi:hypothetical protein
LNETDLKLRLQHIAQAEYQMPPEPDMPKILQAMTHHIGTTDSELRDELIYSTFARWISNGLLTTAQKNRLLDIALDEDHLFYGVGEQGSDAVFTRTFSMLLIVLVLFAHRQQSFLEQQVVQQVLQEVLRYAGLEQDLRGYVEDRGWAHAVAHTADALDELARCNEIEREGLLEILETVRHLVVQAPCVFGHEEDERLSVVVMGALEREVLVLSDWQDWLASLVQTAKESGKSYPQSYYCLLNGKHFLRCVYFRVGRVQPKGKEAVPLAPQLLVEVSRALEHVTRF